MLSFKRQQSIFEAELRQDDTDFLNRLDPGTPARDFLIDIENYRHLIDLFSLSDSLDRGYRQLSSGQARKLCLLQQITRGVTFLVLENPYEGLDRASCREFDRMLAGLRYQGSGPSHPGQQHRRHSFLVHPSRGFQGSGLSFSRASGPRC